MNSYRQRVQQQQEKGENRTVPRSGMSTSRSSNTAAHGHQPNQQQRPEINLPVTDPMTNVLNWKQKSTSSETAEPYSPDPHDSLPSLEVLKLEISNLKPISDDGKDEFGQLQKEMDKHYKNRNIQIGIGSIAMSAMDTVYRARMSLARSQREWEHEMETREKIRAQQDEMRKKQVHSFEIDRRKFDARIMSETLKKHNPPRN